MTGVSRGQRGHKLRETRGLGSPASSKVRAAPCGPGRGPEGQRSLLPERLWSQTPCRLQGAAGQGPTAAAAGERPGSARPPLGSRLHLLRAQAEGSNARSAYFTPSSAIESVLVTTTQKTLWTRGGGSHLPTQQRSELQSQSFCHGGGWSFNSSRKARAIRTNSTRRRSKHASSGRRGKHIRVPAGSKGAGGPARALHGGDV